MKPLTIVKTQPKPKKETADNIIDTDFFLRRMEARELSMRGVAKSMGIDVSRLSLMLRGKLRQGPRPEEIGQLANLLNVPLNEVTAAFIPRTRK